MASVEEVYRQVVLEHNRNPHHLGKLAAPTHSVEANNSLCGDCFTVYAVLEENRIRSIAFDGCGCAISQASMSLMTDVALGRSEDQAAALADSMMSLMKGEPIDETFRTGLGEAATLEEIRAFPMRVSCATLAWKALLELSTMTKTHTSVSTE